MWIGLTLFFFYLLTTAAHPPYGDEEEYLAVAENLLTHGTLTITRTEPATDGQVRKIVTYSKFSLGQSLLILPFAALHLAGRAIFPPSFSFLSNMLVNALPAMESAAMCALLFFLIRLIGNIDPQLLVSRRAAGVICLMSGVATQLWPASRTLFADNSVALLLTFSLYAVIRFARSDVGEGWFIAAAWAMALMVLCKNLFFLACPAVVAYGCWALRGRNEHRKIGGQSKFPVLVLMTVLPFLLTAALQLWHNDLRYGSVWSSGYHEGRDGEFGFSTPLLVGLHGIFLSSGRSLFLYSPLCLLAFLGARSFYKYAKAESLLIAGAALPIVLAYAQWWSWHGGWEWGTRFYVFLIPLLMLISLPTWRWLDQSLSNFAARARMTALALLVAASLGIQVLGLMIHPAAYWFLYVKEVNPFAHPVYQKAVWDIRDDTLLPHFVPEFSPVAAHMWMIWATWNRHSSDDAALASAAPWSSLNPQWAPKNVRPYLGFDLWFLGNWPAGPIAATCLALLAALSVCCLRLRSLLATHPQQQAP